MLGRRISRGLTEFFMRSTVVLVLRFDEPTVPHCFHPRIRRKRYFHRYPAPLEFDPAAQAVIDPH